MHDKQVRRRRAVLGVLVGASLILLTAYFRKSQSSPLHQVQQGIVTVLSPVQEGASKVLSPVRSVANFFSSNFNARSRADRLQNDVNNLNKEVDAYKEYKYLYLQNAQLLHLDQEIGTDANGYAPVAANVYSRDPEVWYQTILVDKGSDDGVRVNDPVIAESGLIGKVVNAYSTTSRVALLTDNSMAVTAEVLPGGYTGVLVPAVGNQNQLELTDLPAHAVIQFGSNPPPTVVTAGFKSGPLDSLYPYGIPIGTVTGGSQAELLSNQQVQVTPTVNLQGFNSVQILTRPQGNTESASTTTTGTTASASTAGATTTGSTTGASSTPNTQVTGG